ncbi:MAG: hypothetical protein JXA46_11595 [Dehalococcoidales bacterium]|nr:hypothetical protein [Dehalococcoidales bacterium]
MEKLRLVFPAILILLATILFCGCENYTQSNAIDGLINKNDLSINMKVEDNSGNFAMEKIYEGDSDNYCLKIDVTETFSLRGEAAIKPGDKYKLSLTLKNIDADPVICYSFWKKPKTSLRNYTFKGENGNPPSAETQETYRDWMTFEETFQTREGEDSFLMTLLSGKGTFYIDEISIEHIQ